MIIEVNNHYKWRKTNFVKNSFDKDSSGTLHVPKRKVEDIIHINSF